MLDIVSYLSLPGGCWCLLDPQPRVRKDRDNHSSACWKWAPSYLQHCARLQLCCIRDAVRHYELYCSAISLKSMMEGSDSITH